MPELIRYSFGHSSLGRFIAATSDKGLVAFEFGDSETELVEQLATRLADTRTERDDAGLQDVVRRLERLADHPEQDPGLAVDLRGDVYQKQVWSLLREIPAGKTTTYSALATTLGTRDARGVTEAIASNPLAIIVPCHRVLKKDGSISGYRWGVHRKRALLKREQR